MMVPIGPGVGLDVMSEKERTSFLVREMLFVRYGSCRRVRLGAENQLCFEHCVSEILLRQPSRQAT